MNRTKIAQLYADAESLGGQTVTVAGWVKSVRDMKNFGFVTLNDGSCFRDLQVVMNREALDNYDEIAHQNVSAALICTGTVKLTPDAPQPFELSATSIEVEGTSAPDYPLQKKRATVEFLRTQQHLRPRTNTFNAVFRVRSECAFAIHEFFNSRGFVYVRESEELMDGARVQVEMALDRSMADNMHDWASVKSRVREALSSYIYRKTKRSPMILPILMEV